MKTLKVTNNDFFTQKSSLPTYPICINSLVPSVKKINIGNKGIQVNYWGGLTPPLILLVTWISNIGFCVPGNQQINANMVHYFAGSQCKEN